jgi:fido (protein-threonine AMPylation protein)
MGIGIDDSTYIIGSEPDYKQRSYNWKTAIGLQQVDGLVPSKYLLETANESIEGKISLVEAKQRIDDYYASQPNAMFERKEQEEADKVSSRIALILSEDAFTFSRFELVTIYRRLFDGIYKFAGQIRDYNITKKEWVLGDESVLYASSYSIIDTLDYDFEQEKNYDYSGLEKQEIVKHIAQFLSGIWQIHPFGEGNTRTIAVFAIKYLNSFGFELTNDAFEKNSLYFRNAFVRANYNNLEMGISATNEYLMKFFGNLLLDENHELKNRDLRVIG